MPTYVAFLRAINVTGRFIKMQELASAFHRLGHIDARTYLNSGNVVFSSRARSAGKIESAIEGQLPPLLGFRSEAFVRTAADLKAIAARAQCLRQRLPASGEVNVCFLQTAPGSLDSNALSALQSAVDSFEVAGLEVYWMCSTKQSDSTFSNAVLERRLNRRSTLRRASMLQGLALQL